MLCLSFYEWKCIYPGEQMQSSFGDIHRHLFTVADSTEAPLARLAIGCREEISILLGRKRSTKDSIYAELGREEVQFYLPSHNLITQECASYQPTMPHHSSSSAPAKSTSTAASTASTSVSASTQRRITCAWSDPLRS